MSNICLQEQPDFVQPLESFVSFSPPLIGEEEINEVVDTLKSGWLTTGPKTEKFENEVKEYAGAVHGVAVNSCTAALHLSLKVLDIGPGDGVITSPFTFASTGHVIMYEQARPFLADIERDTFNINPDAVRYFLETRCTPKGPEGRPRHIETGAVIKAIMPVHYGGHPCRMDELMELAREYNLWVVEDAAHALGSTYKGRKIGSIGDITCFSFYATKNLTTGEGGLAATDNKELAERMRILSMYGISDSRRIWDRYAPKGNWVYDVVELGCKYNMMDIQACLGLHQLKKLNDFIARRNENAAVYDTVFEDLEGVSRPVVKDYAGHARHLYPILLDGKRLGIDRDSFIEVLKEKNIGTSVLFIPLHFHSFYRNSLPYSIGDFPITESVFKGVVNLPVSPAISLETIERVAETIAAIVRIYQ